MARSSRTTGTKRSRPGPEEALSSTTRRLRDLSSVNTSMDGSERVVDLASQRIRNLRREEHTPRWCPADQVSILVGPDQVCPACGSWAPST